jgi:hypothetical protein
VEGRGGENSERHNIVIGKKKFFYVGFEVHTAVVMKSTVVWDILV